MRVKVFAIYDSKTGVYGQPYFVVSRGAMLRGFADMVNDGKSPVWKHPEDYSLFEIGEYDDTLGEIQKCVPTNLGLAASFVEGVRSTVEKNGEINENVEVK